jgi:hypothetical protein
MAMFSEECKARVHKMILAHLIAKYIELLSKEEAAC